MHVCHFVANRLRWQQQKKTLLSCFNETVFTIFNELWAINFICKSWFFDMSPDIQTRKQKSSVIVYKTSSRNITYTKCMGCKISVRWNIQIVCSFWPNTWNIYPRRGLCWIMRNLPGYWRGFLFIYWRVSQYYCSIPFPLTSHRLPLWTINVSGDPASLP